MRVFLFSVFKLILAFAVLFCQRSNLKNIWSNPSMQGKHTLLVCIFLIHSVSAVSKHPWTLVETVTDSPSHTCPTQFAFYSVCVMLSALVNREINGFSCLPQLKPSWKAADSSPLKVSTAKTASFQCLVMGCVPCVNHVPCGLTYMLSQIPL